MFSWFRRKPYMLTPDGCRMVHSANGAVRKYIVDHNRYLDFHRDTLTEEQRWSVILDRDARRAGISTPVLAEDC